MILVHSEKSSFWVNLCSKFIRILIFENVGKGSLSILPKLLWCKKHRSGPPPSASSCLSGLGFRLSALRSLMTEDLLLTLLTEDLLFTLLTEDLLFTLLTEDLLFTLLTEDLLFNLLT